MLKVVGYNCIADCNGAPNEGKIGMERNCDWAGYGEQEAEQVRRRMGWVHAGTSITNDTSPFAEDVQEDIGIGPEP